MASKRLIAAIAGVALAAPLSAAIAAPHTATDLAPVALAAHDGVAGSYIVMLKKSTERSALASTSMASTTATAAAAARATGATVTSELDAIGGYIVTATPEQIQKIRQDSRVLRVSQSRVTSVPETTQESPRDVSVNEVASWGLDRIDQPNLPIDGSYRPPNNGSGVHAYIVDSGIKFDHPEFTGRIGRGYDFYNRDSHAEDCNSHGTHVAGIVGGTKAGVANKVTLHPLRVMACDGKGDDSIIMSVANWMVKNAEKPAVVNLSLGAKYEAGEHSSMDEAMDIMYDAGILPIIAAGNSSIDACRFSPARNVKGLTVGSTYKNDDRSFFSNHGKCLDLFAPGSMIEAADMNNDGLVWNSGTSMAAPHVAGAAAIYLNRYPNASPAEVEQAILRNTVAGKVNKPKKNSPNLMLQVQNLVSGPRPTPTATPTPTPTTTATPTPTPTVTATATPTATSTPTNTAPGTDEFEDTTRQELKDYQSVTSTLQSTLVGGAKVTLSIDINHSCAQHVGIDLTTPDGRKNTVKRSSYASGRRCGSWSGVKSETYTMRSKTDGAWILSVSDNYRGYTGTLNGWKIKFS